MKASRSQCWEICSDFEPAFSLADLQSCSSVRAETYTLQKHFYQFAEVVLKGSLKIKVR